MHRRARRLVVSWIALLAILMASLAPALSHAMGSNGPATWAEICTSAGSRLVPLTDESGKAPALPVQAHALEHCPYCSLHADDLALPPVPPSIAQPVLLGELDPPAFRHADATATVWLSAQPRAPPVLG